MDFSQCCAELLNDAEYPLVIIKQSGRFGITEKIANNPKEAAGLLEHLGGASEVVGHPKLTEMAQEWAEKVYENGWTPPKGVLYKLPDKPIDNSDRRKGAREDRDDTGPRWHR